MIVCVGIGPGDLGFLTQRAMDLFKSADVVSGFDSVLNVVAPLIDPKATVVPLTYRNQVDQLAEVAKAHQSDKACVVGFMGDIHFSGFQLLERVERACGHKVETLPGISSAQILASKARVCFDETTFVTFHRRGDIDPFKQHLVNVLRDKRNAIVIPRPWDFMPQAVCQYLLDEGIPADHQIEVWENLTQREAAWSGLLKDCPDKFSDMSIMLIRTKYPMDPGV